MLEQQTRQDAQELTAPLDLLSGAMDLLSQARDLPTIQELVSRYARRLTGSDGAAFILRDGKHANYVEEDSMAPLWKGQSFPIDECISGWAMLYRQPVAVSDVGLDDRIRVETYSPTFVTSLAMVPIRSTAPVGAIGAYWAATHSASHTEISMLQSLAEAAAVALANPAVDQLAIKDLSSGLFNRRGFFSRGGERTVDNWDQGEGTIVVFATLEGVEEIGRQHGTRAADDAIRGAAAALRGVCGEAAVIGRVEEAAFAACESSTAMSVHDPEELEAAVLASMPESDLPLDLTLGVATTAPGDHMDLDTLVSRASTAMYDRKFGGSVEMPTTARATRRDT